MERGNVYNLHKHEIFETFEKSSNPSTTSNKQKQGSAEGGQHVSENSMERRLDRHGSDLFLPPEEINDIIIELMSIHQFSISVSYGPGQISLEVLMCYDSLRGDMEV